MITNTNYGSSKTRVSRGMKWEHKCREILNQKLGLGLESTSSHEDMVFKQDWRYFDKQGQEQFWQFKWRASGCDVLVDVLQPYYGFKDSRNKPGRDMVGVNISRYVTWPPDYGVIYILNAQHVKNVVQALVEGWEKQGTGRLTYRHEGPLPHLVDGVNSRGFMLTFTEEKGEGMRNGEGKVLAFLPPYKIAHVKITVPMQDRLVA
jgi:hypothetical protein